MKPNSIEYPVIERKLQDREVLVKAGKKWIDTNRHIRYEEIILSIPKEVADKEELVFAVLSIERGKNQDFHLYLHTHSDLVDLEKPYTVTSHSTCHIDAGGDIETRFTLLRDILKKITELTDREIDNAFGAVKIGDTYNLLASMPRMITVTKEKIIITKSLATKVDSMNVCNLIFDNKHPIDP